MLLFTEAYSQNAPHTHMVFFFLLSILLLVRCLSRLFPGMLVGVFETTVRNLVKPPVLAERLLLYSVRTPVLVWTSQHSISETSSSGQLGFGQDFGIGVPNCSLLSCYLIESMVKAN